MAGPQLCKYVCAKTSVQITDNIYAIYLKWQCVLEAAAAAMLGTIYEPDIILDTKSQWYFGGLALPHVYFLPSNTYIAATAIVLQE